MRLCDSSGSVWPRGRSGLRPGHESRLKALLLQTTAFFGLPGGGGLSWKPNFNRHAAKDHESPDP